jgi:hypothetical protein
MADPPPCPRCGEPLGERYALGDPEQLLCWPCFNAATDDGVLTFGDQSTTETAKKRPKGTLPHLPGRDANLSELRGWLTRAFAPPGGYRFDSFERHGRGLSDPAWLTLRAPTGAPVRFRFSEQRALAKPTNVRPAVVSITDGLCRMGQITNPEAADVWVALCSVAHVAAHQDEVDDFREQLESFLRVTNLEGRWTLEPTGRYDALLGIQAAGAFEPRHARLMRDDVDERHWTRRPLRIADAITGLLWVRVGELATYLRHVLGLRLGHGWLDGRMSEIGAARESFEMRNGKTHPHCTLYRLPTDPDAK